MPVILRVDGLRFFFYSNEGNPLEPVHVHIRQSVKEAKVWLEPEVQLARNDGFDARELKRILELSLSHAATLKEAWNEYFT
ncbi:DUF4160 domain-containing protein [Marinospirillum alkaliphilum]|uniref:DUF4160 domain-containing protein n=1 Tax=Marinospirillum alkaliphilum DSM 21637 TaxID=1122209 RepID=A0A1K1UA63_9GAMM|nr:DUF4160 domain-containing protein [Marinospirillum alkaliphilum]SFX09500.1 protein of unknown function [Marinospirillum alkaliphilum DSM 21637]